jgi:hypothetical protein
MIIRKVSNKLFKSHFQKLCKSVSGSIEEVLKHNYDDFIIVKTHLLTPGKDPRSIDNADEEITDAAISSANLSYPMRRTEYLIDGLVKLIFSSIKGIKGCFHSKGIKRINLLLTILSSSFSKTMSASSEENVDENKLISKQFSIQITGTILLLVLKGFIKYLYHENMIPLLSEILSFLSTSVKELKEVRNVYAFQPLKQSFVDLCCDFYSLIIDNPQWKRKLDGILKDKQFIKLGYAKTLIDTGIDLFLYINDNNNHCSMDTVKRSRNLFVKLWILFPASKEILPQLDVILPAMLLRKTTDKHEDETTQERIYYFLSHLYNSVSVTVRDTHLLPLLLKEMTKLAEDTSKQSWLLGLLKVLYTVRDPRENTDTVLSLGNNSMNSSLPSVNLFESIFQSSSGLLLQLIKEKKNKKDLLTAGVDVSLLRLSVKVMNWFVVNYSSLTVKTKNYQQIVTVYKEFIKNLYSLLSNLLLPSSFGLIADSFELYFNFLKFSSNRVSAIKEEKEFLSSVIKKLVQFLSQRSSSLALTYILAYLLDGIKDTNSPSDDNQHQNDEIDEDNYNSLYLLEEIVSSEEKLNLLSSISEGLSSSSFYLKFYLIKILQHVEPPIKDGDALSRGVMSKKVKRVKMYSPDSDDDDDDDNSDHEGLNENPHLLDIPSILYETITIPINIRNEREILRRLEVLEVFCRGSSKLSKEWLSIIGGFSVGLFYSKYKPFWISSSSILLTISQAENGEEIIWNLYFPMLEKNSHINTLTIEDDEVLSEERSPYYLLDKYDTEEIVSDEVKESSLFWINIGSLTATLPVPPDATADRETVYLQLLDFLKKAPAILLKRSKLIVDHFVQ